MNRTRFTDSMIAEALKAADGNVSAAAAALGCSQYPVDEYRRREGLTRPLEQSTGNLRAYENRRRFSDLQLLVAVLRHGDDTRAIAAKFGCKPAAINKHRRHLDIPSAGVWRPESARWKRVSA